MTTQQQFNETIENLSNFGKELESQHHLHHYAINIYNHKGDVSNYMNLFYPTLENFSDLYKKFRANPQIKKEINKKLQYILDKSKKHVFNQQ